MESLEFVDAIKSGFPWRVVDKDRWIIGLEFNETISNKTNLKKQTPKILQRKINRIFPMLTTK